MQTQMLEILEPIEVNTTEAGTGVVIGILPM